MADINAIVEEIKALSLLEVKELTDALKETFGVEAIAMGAPAAGAGAAAAEVEEKTEFDVVLASFCLLYTSPFGAIRVSTSEMTSRISEMPAVVAFSRCRVR